MQNPETELSPEQNPAQKISVDDNLVVITGFGNKGIPDFVKELSRSVRFASQKIIWGCPSYAGGRDPQERLDYLNDLIEDGGDKKFMIGHSYGAFLALALACRRYRYHGVFNGGLDKLVLIDGPLHPDVEVSLPEGVEFFKPFLTQYRHRPGIAQQCMDSCLKLLPKADLAKILTIGSAVDNIVPPAAKSLPNIEHIELPPDMTGHNLSPAKIREIVRILVGKILNDKI